MGQKSLGNVYPHMPGFDMQTTLVPSHTSGSRLSMRLAWAILQEGTKIWSSAFSKPGYIPSSLGYLYGLKEPMAHLFLDDEAFCPASRRRSFYWAPVLLFPFQGGTGAWRCLSGVRYSWSSGSAPPADASTSAHLWMSPEKKGYYKFLYLNNNI